MPSHSSAYQASAGYVWYVIALLAVVNLFNYVDRMALAVLAPFIKADLELSDAQLGLLTGFAFALFYAVCAIPIARWADRGIRRTIIALALATWSTMTALSGAAQNFWHLFLARVGVGAGEAGSYAPGASILCDYVPLERRSGVLAIHIFGNASGILVGMALAGWLGEILGWRWTFVVLGLPGIALAAVVRFTLREPPRGFFDAAKDDQRGGSWREVLGCLWRCRTYRWLTVFLVGNGFVHFGFNQWWPSFYARLFAADLAAVGVYLGIAYGACNGVGVLIGGLTANKAARYDLRLPLRISAAAAALSVPSALGSLFVPTFLGSMLLVGVTGALWGVSMGPVMAGAYSVVTSHMRVTAGAISIFLSSVLGFGLGPFCVGLLSDMLAPSLGVQSLRYALLAPVCLAVVMVMTLLTAAKTLTQDLKAVGAQGEYGPRTASPIEVAVAK